MPNCEVCGEPMPAGEEMFKYHGYSGPCPKPSLLREEPMTLIEKLLNPQWTRRSPPSDDGAILDTTQTLATMDEAAAELKRKLKVRPVAFRVKASNGDWILYEDEAAAASFAEANGIEYQGLYVRA